MEVSEKFGLLAYSSMNIGDEIQSVAAERFLPDRWEFVHREGLSRVVSRHPIKVIMNGWWMWNLKSFPFSPALEPLLISMHIRKEAYKLFSTSRVKAFLHSHGPVGARDLSTLRFLDHIGVEAYFSGCLTQTIRPSRAVQKEDFLLAVDLSPGAVRELRKSTGREVRTLSPVLNPALSHAERLSLAKLHLFAIQSAGMVVSPRLHTLLPALALGTPTLRIVPVHDKLDTHGRFSGYETLFHQANEHEITQAVNSFDFQNPFPDLSRHIGMAGSLEGRVKEFTGIERSCNGLPNLQDAFFLSMYIHRKRRSDLRKSVWMVSTKSLLKTLIRRVLLRQTKHGIDF